MENDDPRQLARSAHNPPMTHPAWEGIVPVVDQAPAEQESVGGPICVRAERRHERVNHRQRFENRGVDRYRSNSTMPLSQPRPSLDMLM